MKSYAATIISLVTKARKHEEHDPAGEAEHMLSDLEAWATPVLDEEKRKAKAAALRRKADALEAGE